MDGDHIRPGAGYTRRMQAALAAAHSVWLQELGSSLASSAPELLGKPWVRRSAVMWAGAEKTSPDSVYPQWTSGPRHV